MISQQDRRSMRYEKLYPIVAVCAVWLLCIACVFQTPRELLRGLFVIMTSESVLITDYFAVAGAGAALANCALVVLVSVGVLYVSGEKPNGYTVVTLGLMAGFSLFGKNLLNLWPILLGTWCYARFRREPFGKYVSVGLLATALSPLVSFMAFGSHSGNHALEMALGVLLGLLIGFVMPPLAAYTFQIQNGMNLYNIGFACGLLGMMLVPVLTALGYEPNTAMLWTTGNNLPFGLTLAAACVGCVLTGLFWRKDRALGGYQYLLHTTGRAPSDYLRAFGTGAVLINMGVNGLIATGYILLIGGDLNGPTVGGIVAVMAFSAYGKHAGNIIPVMAGVWIGSMVNAVPVNDPALQLAALFGTTLAPVSGVFGWPYGILAGLLHSSVVLRAGIPLSGMNLYNNGFSGGLIAMVLFPVVTAIARHRKPEFQDQDYYDMFQQDYPIDPGEWKEPEKEK